MSSNKNFKKSYAAANADVDMITVNNLFAVMLKEINIKRYSDDIPILPLNNVLDVYIYPDVKLKHMPEKSLKTFQSDLLYSNKTGRDRTVNNTNDVDDRSDDKLDDRITKFHNLLGINNKVYRIPLRFLVDLGLANFPIKFDTKFVFTLEQNYNKLFESCKSLLVVPTTAPDTNIMRHAAPYIQYERLKLNGNFKKYFEASLLSKRVLRTGIKPSPFQKSYDINRCIQSYVLEFKGANKQFLFLEISLEYDKSDQYNTLYDSYNVELASAKIDSTKFKNANNNYSVSNEIKFDLGNENDRFLLYRQFAAWYTSGCSVAPITDYANNDVYRKLSRLKTFTLLVMNVCLLI